MNNDCNSAPVEKCFISSIHVPYAFLYAPKVLDPNLPGMVVGKERKEGCMGGEKNVRNPRIKPGTSHVPGKSQ